MKETPIQKIEKSLIKNRRGMTIQQIIDETGMARGTVKTYLDEMMRMGRVHEEEYGQNTKVFFLNGKGEFQQNVQMHDDGVLFVDVLTDPWKKPFVRVKYKKNKKDVGVIIINNEEAVDKLIRVLENAKPQLEKYRELVNKIESSQMKN